MKFKNSGLTFLFSKEKLQKKIAPDEDTGASASFFAKIFAPLRSEEKFSKRSSLALRLRTSYGADGNARVQKCGMQKQGFKNAIQDLIKN